MKSQISSVALLLSLLFVWAHATVPVSAAIAIPAEKPETRPVDRNTIERVPEAELCGPAMCFALSRYYVINRQEAWTGLAAAHARAAVLRQDAGLRIPDTGSSRRIHCFPMLKQPSVARSLRILAHPISVLFPPGFIHGARMAGVCRSACPRQRSLARGIFATPSSLTSRALLLVGYSPRALDGTVALGISSRHDGAF
jgi:hypothetical protein